MAKERRPTRSSTFRWVSRKVMPPEPEPSAIGFLSLEITALMSKLVQLWNRLEDNEFSRAKQNLSNSIGIRKLISTDEAFLTELFMKEIVEDLQYIAKSIVRFGAKCSDPVLHEFERFVKDPLKNEFNWFGWQYKWKKMDRRVKKMQRFVVLTAELWREMEILAEVERNLKRTTTIFSFSGGQGKSFKYRKKISWHRRRVQSLKLITPWNRTFDYIFRLFMRSMITIIERIKIVFGVREMRRPEESGEKSADRLVPAVSYRWSELEEQGKKQNYNHSPPLMKISSESKRFTQFPHFRSFRDCKNREIGSSQPSLPVRKTSSLKVKNRAVDSRASSSPKRTNGGHYSISSFFIKENLSNSPKNSLGAAALAIHYGKIVVSIENLASAPHLIGSEERDDLFNMLPVSIVKALRLRLRKTTKARHSSLYDPVLAAESKSAMAKILQWLAPMAHDMNTWHSEQSFEKQPDCEGNSDGGGSGSRSHVLLLQTLHYADREKTEDAIVELLVALSNICSSNEVCEKRLLNPLGVEAHRNYFSRNDGFSHFHV
ncbi:protein PSK SIMULATOR 2-like [Benincasa hispida]|uniref:protein PSK SIMULATOR 2-like n=1 Tax=Benincasa hispida TaxID=102211 RepID=UPI0019023417|nr:protein PSK SIMULATOR 2-like [Benincasa hispida]